MKKLIFILFLFSMYLYSQTDNKTKVYERLREYVYEGNVREAENILKKYNGDINNLDYEDFTLLSIAVMDNNIEMAELLLKYKADVNTVVSDGDTALILAVDNNNMEMVKLLLSYGADIDYQGFRGRTALFSSLNKGDNGKENIEMVKLLIKNKADVNIAYDGDYENEETPLMYAIMKGYKETVKILIENKADINRRNRNNANALIYAYMYGHEDIANILLQNGSDSLDKSLKVCDLNQSTLLNLNVPLINAAHYSTNEVFLQKLIDSGSYKDYDYDTALREAASYNNINAVKVLIKNNADVNVQNRDGMTALMSACYNGNLEMTKMLLDAGADKSIKRGNYDALYYAREYGKNEEIIKLLTK
ncbi:ankyrin repeat-containing protein [Brachyspira intermedia PWS/A]|uniref:Ankyrin repeat-containing protein n=1 Tax=Brachyspira intermedia (strain ATCC 51140 / PWS/A) TaxID=1045858 RepID=G0ENG2_BRAIP|nr:ankyrin repeat domain-containing protein [Brachyspira intermedia]AEM21841.1 ankyrin repeat-containing protein [Brachyspira intermedia PWS/A]